MNFDEIINNIKEHKKQIKMERLKYKISGDYYVYVLKLDDSFYVGKTKNVFKRAYQHLVGNTCRFTSNKNIRKVFKVFKCQGNDNALALENFITQKILKHRNQTGGNYQVIGGKLVLKKVKEKDFIGEYFKVNFKYNDVTTEIKNSILNISYEELNEKIGNGGFGTKAIYINKIREIFKE